MTSPYDFEQIVGEKREGKGVLFWFDTYKNLSFWKSTVVFLFQCLQQDSSLIFSKYLGGDPKSGTQFEQLVQKLMECDGDPGLFMILFIIFVHVFIFYSVKSIQE